MKRLLWIMLLLTSCTTYGQPSRATIDQWHEIHAEQQRIAQKTLEMFPDTWQEFFEFVWVGQP